MAFVAGGQSGCRRILELCDSFPNGNQGLFVRFVDGLYFVHGGQFGGRRRRSVFLVTAHGGRLGFVAEII